MCVYNTYIQKHVRSFRRPVASAFPVSRSLALFRSLPLSRSLLSLSLSLSATKVGTVFFAVSRIIVSYLNNRFKLAPLHSRGSSP